jgi:oligopeptidase A
MGQHAAHQLDLKLAESARRPGYASHAEVSLVPKMAQSPRRCWSFARSCAPRRLSPKDMAGCAPAREELGMATCSLDAPAASKLRAKRYSFSTRTKAAL